MDLDRTASLISRAATLAATALVAIAGAEWLANILGYTLLRRLYTPGRVLEFAAILMLFVIVVLLRQVREELRRRKA